MNSPAANASGVVARNVIANFVGRGWTAALAFLFVPLYLHFLGIEAYGLIGVFATMQAFFNLLDLGMGATLNRELARTSLIEGSGSEQRSLLRTLEVVYWMVSLVVGVVIFAVAPAIASRWVHPVHVSTATVTNAVRLMSAALIVQFPFALYQGGLYGLQRHVLLNTLLTVTATVRSVGAVLILWLVSNTIEAFLVWQCLVSFAATIGTAVLVRRSLQPATTEAVRFDTAIVRRVWRFAAGVSGIALLNAVFTQTDKVILSRWLKLDMFGYYMLAQSLAGVLWSVVGPFSAAVFPRFAQMSAVGAEDQLRDLYHRTCQTLSVAILPIFLMLVVFPHTILLTWTFNPAVARNAATIVALAACGVFAICIADVPHFLRLSHGWYAPSLIANAILVVLFLPLVVVMASRFGVVGAAATWAAINALYTLTIPVTHTRILRGEFGKWLRDDVALPLAGAASVILLCSLAAPYVVSRGANFVLLGLTWLTATAAAALLAPQVRRMISIASVQRSLGMR